MNSLKIDLTNKRVVMMGDGPEANRIVTINDGFGALSETRGTAIFVTDRNGKSFRMDGMEVERLAECQRKTRSKPLIECDCEKCVAGI